MSNKLGVHALVFTEEWNAATAKLACDSAARIGFDLIEVLMFDPWTLDLEATRKATADSGLELRLGMALGPNSDPTSDDEEIVANAQRDVGRALEIASDLGAPAVSGITYAAFNVYNAKPTAKQHEQVLEHFRKLDARAGELGVRLGIEPVNRYESYLVQTLDQGAEIIRKIGADNLFLHMDTFHMNIEEASISAAIQRNADLLGYAHVADNNRGLLGAGSFDFSTFFRSLAQAGYDGDITIETFSSSVLGEDIVGAVSLWREPWKNSDAAAASALSFMRSQVEVAQAAVSTW